jgi:hypothetical protein
MKQGNEEIQGRKEIIDREGGTKERINTEESKTRKTAVREREEEKTQSDMMIGIRVEFCLCLCSVSHRLTLHVSCCLSQGIR